MVVTEEYAIPDKMVGLSKSALLLPQDYLDIRVVFFFKKQNDFNDCMCALLIK